MGKKNKRGHPKTVRPAYYSEKRLTVGMLEDLCRGIKDKTASVMVADKAGSGPDTAKSGMVLHRGNNPIGLLLLGGWEWGSNGDEDADDDDAGEDSMMLRNVYEDVAEEDAWEAYYEQKYGPTNGASCRVDKEPGDCVLPDGMKVKYLDDEFSYGSASKSNEVQQA